MSDELPNGWNSAPLEAVVVAKKGKKPAVLRDSPADGFVPYLDIHAIEKSVVRQFAEVKSSRLAAKDDLFVVWDGARSGWVGGGITGAIGSTIMALTAQQVESSYVRHFIASQFQTLNNNTRGTGIPHVDPEVFWNLEIPVAPLVEQRRIVAKLETLLGKVDASQQRLAKIPVLLKRFRQSVLAAACSGRLTADWREENPDAEPYPVETVESEEDFPATWRATRVGSLTTLVTSGSRGWAKYYSDSGSTFIRAQNINSDFLNLDDIAFVRPAVSAEGLRTKVQQHDILITITGANVTKSALVEKRIEDAYVSQHVALVRLKDNRLGKFLFHS
ncbi:MAG TPA: restriction endonuclease subunit S, partial [Verrucomicrobiae bacterium]|nr:restriction endonuclease subunit S [Verrucomicrobiae bacterium]